MDETLYPTAGVRVLLELFSTEITPQGATARYLGAVFTPTTRIDYLIAINAGGGVMLVERPNGATHDSLVQALARTIAKDALATSPPTWPRRILRWRNR